MFEINDTEVPLTAGTLVITGAGYTQQPVTVEKLKFSCEVK